MTDYVHAAEIAAKAGARAAKAGGRATRYASQLASAAVLKVIDAAFPPPFLNDIDNVLAVDDAFHFRRRFAADLFPQHTKTSAPTPGAVDGPAEGETPEPSAVVDEMRLELCSCGCGQQVYRRGPPSLSAAVEPPASVPAAESLGLYVVPEYFAPTPEFDWVAWVIPAITDVLAEHRPIGGQFQDGVAEPIFCVDFTRRHRMCADWQAWRDHVAPLIAARIHLAASQQ